MRQLFSGRLLNNLRISLLIFSYTTFACATYNVEPIRLLDSDATLETPYENLGKIAARCRVQASAKAAEEKCWKKLQRKAEKLGANRILLELPILTEEGSPHTGFKLVEIECRGVAMRVSARSRL